MSMIIRVTDISPRGLAIDDTLSLQALNDRMNEGRNNVIFFTAPPHITVTISKSGDGAEIKGQAEAPFRQPCSFCGRELEQHMTVPLELILKPQKGDGQRAAHENDDFLDEDIGIIYFEGDTFDLEDIVQESLILALIPYWRPAADEHGNCSVCGLNFEEAGKTGEQEEKKGINLGQLLKKAGLK